MKKEEINLTEIIEILKENQPNARNLNTNFGIPNARCAVMLPQIDGDTIGDADNYGELITVTLEEAIRVADTPVEVFYVFYHIIHSFYKARREANNPLAALMGMFGSQE